MFSYTFTSSLNIRRHYNIYCSICHNEIHTQKRRTRKSETDFAVIYLPKNNMTLLASILTFGLSSVSISGLSLLPPFQEGDVPGSTDGILLMGILIVLIVVVPIVWTRRKWMR